MAHRHRHELTDAQWSKIEHLLPGKKSDPGRTAGDNRPFVNAVVYVLKAGELLPNLRRGTVAHVIADAAYDSDDLRRRVRDLGARACIKPNPTRKRKKRYDRRRYKRRNVIERSFCRIRRRRRVATRYEKKAANFAGFVYHAAFVTTED